MPFVRQSLSEPTRAGTLPHADRARDSVQRSTGDRSGFGQRPLCFSVRCSYRVERECRDAALAACIAPTDNPLTNRVSTP